MTPLSTATPAAASELVRTILSHSPDPLVAVSSQGLILFWNKPASQSLGYQPDELLGHPLPIQMTEAFQEAKRSAILGIDAHCLLEGIHRSGVAVSLEAKLAGAGPAILLSWKLPETSGLPDSVASLRAQLEEKYRELREARSLIRATLGTGREVTVLLSAEGAVRFISPNYGQVNQLPPEQLIKGDVTERIHPDDAGDIMEAVRLVAESPGASITRQARVLDGNGNYIWVEATGVNLLHDESIQAIVVKSRNIGSERALRDALERREQNLRMALESAEMISFDWNLSDDSVRFSHDFSSFFGVNPSEGITARRYLIAFHPDETDRILAAFANVNSVGGSVNEEFMGSVPLSSGQFPHYQFRSRTFFASDGTPERVLGVVSNITARRLAEEDVMLAKARLAEAQKLARLGAWGMQFHTYVVWWSDSMYELCGMSKDSFTPTAESIFERLEPEDKPRVIEMFYSLYQKAESDPLIVRFRKPNGDIVFFNVHVAVERDRWGKVTSVLGTVQDITRQVEDEQEKNLLRERVQRQQELESLGILAGGIAHDFNNLLTPILGYAKLASAALPATSSVQKSLDEVERGVLRAAELCRQMLAYAGRGRFIVGPQCLNEIAREMTQLLESTISPRAQLHLHLSATIPSIEADATQVRQVVMNLLTNASDSLGEKAGHIHVATGVVYATKEILRNGSPPADLPEGEYVFIDVRDTGCGMTRETIERIFEPFFTTKFTGRGLGLAACLGIVRSHSGTILVESVPDKGSMFRVLFPPSTAPVREPVLEDSDSDDVDLGRARVLVVDDSEPIRAMATSSLEAAGLEVVSAQDGLEALEVLREDSSIEMVVLDLTMPRLGGLETLSRIHKEGYRPPILLMSGYSEEELQARFGHLGFSAFLPKPFRPADLVRTVRRVLAAHRARAENRESI
ncbi:PAS domain-containing protein [bacterium]|nr:PAS domain-containing protein [bacterium]